MINVIGLGNVLTTDDGLGPYTVRVLDAEYEFPETVKVVDAGTPGLDFAPYLDNARALIVIDTVSSKGPPGSLKIYNMDDLLATPPPDRMTPHQPGLREALMAAELTDQTPDEIILVGVVPESTELGTRLSDPVQAAVPEVIATVMNELDRLGVKPPKRDQPLEPDIWWE